MKDIEIKTLIFSKKCETCGSEYHPQNIHTAKYCPNCKEVRDREKTRKRVEEYRRRQREKEYTSGY